MRLAKLSQLWRQSMAIFGVSAVLLVCFLYTDGRITFANGVHFENRITFWFPVIMVTLAYVFTVMGLVSWRDGKFPRVEAVTAVITFILLTPMIWPIYQMGRHPHRTDLRPSISSESPLRALNVSANHSAKWRDG